MHADTLRLSNMSGGTIQRGGNVSLLTDAGVTAADTLAGLDSFVNGVNVHADQYNYKARVKLGWRTTAEYTDAAVLSLTTVAGLVALSNLGTNPTGLVSLLPDG